MSDALVITDASGAIVHANGACEDLLGWDPDELRGKRIEKLVPDRLAADIAAHPAFQRGKKPEPKVAKTLSALHRAGHEFPAEILLQPVDVDGAHYVLATFRPAAERREQETRLRLLSVAVGAAASGVVITDARGTITWANPAACRMTGYTAEELIGSSPKMLKSGHHDDAFYAQLWATISSCKTWSGAIVNRRKDGSTYHEEQTIAPVTGPNGAITHYIAIKQDVTARVEAEAKLLTMSHAVRNAANGLALTDLSGRIQFANPAMLSLWCCARAEDMSGRNLLDLWHDRDQARDMLADVLQSEGLWFGEAMARRDDTGEFPVQIAASQNRDGAGAIIGLIFSFSDISDRHRAEEAMKQAEAHKAMLASLGAACHHIGQPATVIVANCDILARHLKNAPDDVAHILATTRKACGELQGLLNRLTSIDVYKTIRYLDKTTDVDADTNQIVEI